MGLLTINTFSQCVTAVSTTATPILSIPQVYQRYTTVLCRHLSVRSAPIEFACDLPKFARASVR